MVGKKGGGLGRSFLLVEMGKGSIMGTVPERA